MAKQPYYISERVRQIPPSGIRKYFDLAYNMKDVISLGVGEPDFITPWHIREAAIDAINRGHTMYTSNYGLIELRQEISNHLKKHYDIEYNPDNELLITVGVSEALDISIRVILDPGDEIIIHDPCYVAYIPCIIMAGAIPVAVPTTVENNYRLLASEVEKRITKKTKAILLGYPNNPTGAIMHKNDLIKIAELAKKYNLLVISDEIYDRLVYNSSHTCFSSLPGMKERTILLGGFSKAYAMTGWRIGYAAANNKIIEAMMKIHQYIMMCAPIMGQKAALEALKHGENDVQEMVADYNRRRRIIVKGLNDIGLTCFEPKGAFYTFPSVKITGLSSQDLAEKLLEEEHVIVVPGSVFGKCGEGHVRCCYAVSLDSIQEALHRMAKFVDRHRID